jgi:hypothetical protein
VKLDGAHRHVDPVRLVRDQVGDDAGQIGAGEERILKA